jgi:hypothetical protein
VNRIKKPWAIYKICKRNGPQVDFRKGQGPLCKTLGISRLLELFSKRMFSIGPGFLILWFEAKGRMDGWCSQAEWLM